MGLSKPTAFMLGMFLIVVAGMLVLKEYLLAQKRKRWEAGSLEGIQK